MAKTANPKRDLSDRQKEELFVKVLTAAVDLDFKKGFMKWSMSDLSRASGVTRSLIYYYFGSKKEDIVREAIKIIGSLVYGFSDERFGMWARGDGVKSIAISRKNVYSNPAIFGFYFTHRIKQSFLDKDLSDLDKQFFDKMKKLFPGVPPERLQLIWALSFGLVVCPGLSDKLLVDHEETILRMFQFLVGNPKS